MSLAEPMTVATDYALAALGVILGLRLLRAGSGWPSRLVALSFLVLAATALVGGSLHGLAPGLSVPAKALLWRVVYGGVGLGNLFLLAGVLLVVLPTRWRASAMAVLALRFLVATALALGRDFSFVLRDIALTLLLLLGIALFFTLVRRQAFGPFLLFGVVVSLLGAFVQALQIAPHPSFNHNDLFHVLQMGGLYLCYRAARAFPGQAAKGA